MHTILPVKINPFHKFKILEKLKKNWKKTNKRKKHSHQNGCKIFKNKAGHLTSQPSGPSTHLELEPHFPNARSFALPTSFQSWLNIRITWGAFRILEIGSKAQIYWIKLPRHLFSKVHHGEFWCPSRVQNQHPAFRKRHGSLQKSHLCLWEGALVYLLTETVCFSKHYLCIHFSRPELGLVN